MIMRVLAGVLGLTFIVVTCIAITQGEFRGSFLFAFAIGPAFLFYAFAGQKGLEKFFPQLVVLSHSEISPNVTLESLGIVELPHEVA